MSIVDVMEELAGQIKTQVEIASIILETWHNDLKNLKSHFSDVSSKIPV